MRTVRLIWALAVLALAVGCSSVSVKHDYDPGASFAAYKTYSWLPVPTNGASNVKAALERNTLLDKRIRESVNQQLAAKDYAAEDGNPDFMVVYHVGAQDRIDVTNWGYGYRGWYGAGRVDVQQYVEGTLILDVIDAKTKQLVWRGSVTGAVDPDATPEKRAQRMNEAIAKMLADFPPPAK